MQTSNPTRRCQIPNLCWHRPILLAHCQIKLSTPFRYWTLLMSLSHKQRKSSSRTCELRGMCGKGTFNLTSDSWKHLRWVWVVWGIFSYLDYARARKETKLVFGIGQLWEKHTTDMPKNVEGWVWILEQIGWVEHTMTFEITATADKDRASYPRELWNDTCQKFAKV